MSYAKSLGLSGSDFEWHDRAACNDANRPADVKAEWFLSPLDYRPKGRAADEPSVRRALAVCARCPVIQNCKKQAQTDRTGVRGVWGGKYRRGQPGDNDD